MFERPEPIDPMELLELTGYRLDALDEMLDLDRRAAAGEPISSEELDESVARCIDVAMAQEEHWL